MLPDRILPSGIDALNTDHATWVLRDHKAIIGFDPARSSVPWRLSLPYFDPGRDPSLHTFGDRIVTGILRPAGSEELGVILSLRPADGAVDWSIPVSRACIPPATFRGGIVPISADRFFLSDPTTQTSRTLDAATGRTLIEHPYLPMLSAWRIGERWLIRAYQHGQRDEVLLVDFIDGVLRATPTVLRLHLGDTSLIGRTVWASALDPDTGAPALLGTQLPCTRIDARIPLPDGPRHFTTLRRTGHADHLLLHGAESLLCIDPATRRVLWSRAVPTESIPALHDGAILLCESVTPEGDADYTGRISWLDPLTGDAHRVQSIDLPAERVIRSVPGGLLANLSYLPESLTDDPWATEGCVLLTERPTEPLHLLPAPPTIPILSRLVLDTTAVEAMMQAFTAAIEEGQSSGRWTRPAAEIRRIFALGSLKRPVLAALKTLPPAAARASTWASMFGVGPGDQLVPAVIIKTRSSGRYTLLDLRTGRTATTHHDNLGEFGGEHRDLLERSPPSFLDRFFSQYG
jgi:hypothetical protein